MNLRADPHLRPRASTPLAKAVPTTVLHVGVRTHDHARLINTSAGLAPLGPRGLGYRLAITDGTALCLSVKTNGGPPSIP